MCLQGASDLVLCECDSAKKEKSQRLKVFFSEFVVSAVLCGTFLPLFVKRSFWEEWGTPEDGQNWSDGGIELVRSFFVEAIGACLLNLVYFAIKRT